LSAQQGVECFDLELDSGRLDEIEHPL
jgi:hypothetical protein